jgi:hypothetical protein
MLKSAQRQMERSALFSRCGTFRYRLGRRWGEGPRVAFVLLNPSTADELVDDPTIRRCIGFAQREGFGGLEIVNLYAYRATRPVDLRRAGYPTGPENDMHIAAAISDCAKVVVAWGVQARGSDRPEQVLDLLRQLRKPAYCLRVTLAGHPEHPLRLPGTCKLSIFRPPAQ